MKVAVLTFHYSCSNYGAVLQPYALTTVLKHLKIKADLINFVLPSSFSGRVSDLVFGLEFKRFRNQFLQNRTRRVCSEKDFSLLNSQYDYFIVGSDQVWRYKYIQKNYARYFFDFVEDDKKKLSYAASFGIDNWDEADLNVTSHIKTLLSKFEKISVREDSGVNICKNTFGLDSECVLDPTLLCDRNVYDSIINSMSKSNKVVATYILDKGDFSDLIVKKISDELKLPIVNMLGFQSTILGKSIILYNSVSKWLSLLRDSDFIITDSFHCVALSIVYKKNFCCILNESRGKSRIYSLLKMLDLDSRIIINEYSNVNYNSINYSIVFEKLDYYRAKSMDYLTKMLK